MGQLQSEIGRVDLHLHTRASDGVYMPEEVVAMAAGRGLEVMAITDHDTTAGLASAQRAAQAWGITLIPGVELSAGEKGEELHLLGYFVDARHEPFQEALRGLRRQRWARARRIVEALASLGLRLEGSQLESQAWDSVGRPHIARALWLRGYVSSPRQAFDLFLDPGRPAYVPLPRPSLGQAVGLIRGAGGLAVLAHPLILGRDEVGERLAYLDRLLPVLREAGLAGLEAYCYEYSPQLRANLAELAEAHGLVPTGGSDFHGLEWRQAWVGDVYLPMTAVERLREKRAEAGRYGLATPLPAGV